MTALVVTALAVVVVVIGVTGVVAARLVSVAKASAAGIERSADRLRPLAQELGDEVAVTQTELAALQDRTSRNAEEKDPRRTGETP